MPSIRDYLDPGGRILAHRIDQLCGTLENLSGRLRGAMAAALGETLGGLVRDTALHALDVVTQQIPGSIRHPTHPGMHDRYAQDIYDQEEADYWADEEERLEPIEKEQSASSPQERLPRAVSAGLLAASWWLRRWSGQGRTWTTLTVGLVAAGLALLGGPLVAAVLVLTESLTQFGSLAEVAGTGSVTRPFGSS